MIKIRCGNCSQAVGVPDKFAGKRVLCPKCKAAIDVPHSPEGGAGRPNLIKFRCPRCKQKIGLSPEYAGRRVRCAKCKNTLKVPAVTPAPKTPALADKAGPPADDFNPLADLPDLNEPLQPKRRAEQEEAPLRLSPLDESARQKEFVDMTGRIPAAATSAISRGGGGSTALKVDNTPLALLAGIIFVILGGMLWGLIAKYAHLELGLLAGGIGVLAGLGIYLFTTSRGVLLGIAAALIAFFGILCGKYFIAKWYYMPKLMAEFKQEGAARFVDPNNVKLSEEDVRRIMTEPGQMFGLVAMQLADDGKITKDDADYATMKKFAGDLGQAGRDGYDEQNEAQRQEMEQRRKDVEAKVYKCLAEWDDQKKTDVVKTQYPKIMKEFADALAKSPIMSVVGFAVAYISAFSLFDLIWFPLAMVTAYKFGTGENG